MTETVILKCHLVECKLDDDEELRRSSCHAATVESEVVTRRFIVDAFYLFQEEPPKKLFLS